ncbi:hypothetical protein E2K69_12460, partial [Escherichia coli]
RWEHIDLRQGVAHLPETKNGHSRDVPLSRRARNFLQMMPVNLNGNVSSAIVAIATFPPGCLGKSILARGRGFKIIAQAPFYPSAQLAHVKKAVRSHRSYRGSSQYTASR